MIALVLIMNTKTPEYQNTKTPEHQNTRTPGHQNSWYQYWCSHWLVWHIQNNLILSYNTWMASLSEWLVFRNVYIVCPEELVVYGWASFIKTDRGLAQIEPGTPSALATTNPSLHPNYTAIPCDMSTCYMLIIFYSIIVSLSTAIRIKGARSKHKMAHKFGIESRSPGPKLYIQFQDSVT